MAEGQVTHASGANSAIYLKLSNRGLAADRLVAAEALVAQAVEIHETRMEGDVMTMQQVTGGLEIPAGGQVELKPGGYHIMLIGLTQDLKAGDRFPVTLDFAEAGPITVEAEVRQPQP
jgi:copper(I)-binding protein